MRIGARRFVVVMLALVMAPLATAAAAPYVPPPAAEVPGYFPQALSCDVLAFNVDDVHRSIEVDCKGNELSGKTLRELAILRNTIYARYGWDGFRKQWLHDYFHAQKWFKPNPAFSYKLINKADRENAHIIGSMEASFNEPTLQVLRAEIYARHGKVWNDVFKWTWRNGKKTTACDKPVGYDGDDSWDEEEDAQSWDCTFKSKGYRPDSKFSEANLTPDERIEIGLISRALGEFRGDSALSASAQSLDHLLPVGELRKLSLRDLRMLRNSIYARRGRPFKSPIVRAHFRGMKWYEENSAYTDKLLSQTDVRNVRLIRSVEEEFGGALGDEDWLIEPSVDGA
jgi:hypothetical protein